MTSIDYAFYAFLATVLTGLWATIGFIYFYRYCHKDIYATNKKVPRHIYIISGPIIWLIQFRIYLYNKRRGL